MKVFMKIFFWACLIAYLIIALGFTAQSKKGLICNEVSVIIEDSLKRRFYTREDIGAIIRNGGIPILGYPINDINTRELEELFKAKPYIRRVDVYTAMDGKLAVRVKQRDPILRIITAEGKGCYIDNEGYVMPESRKYAHYVMVASGHFPGYSRLLSLGRIDVVEGDKNYKAWHDVLQLAMEINRNEFLRNQIVQIYLNRQGNFELYPRVGAHQIILGNTDNLNDKLENLSILYKKGLP